MATQKFFTTIVLEPSTGTIRGKLPATLVKALDAEDGDVIEYSLKDGSDKATLRVMSSKEARSYKAESGRGKGQEKAKATKAKNAKKAKKGRKTEVEYDEPKKKKGKKGKKAEKASKVKVSKKAKKGKKGKKNR